MFKQTPFFFFALLLSANLSAQVAPKYGHMNLGNVLELMPETKKADEDIKAFGNRIGATDDSLTQAFQAEVNKFQESYDKGELTPVQAQARQAELQKKQEAIQKFEQDAQQLIGTKREELLRPILTKMDEAVKAVAKELGYAMIFDTSTGAMLFAAETDDISAAKRSLD